MLSRRSLVLAALASTLAPLPALSRNSFSDEAFDAAAASGKPVLLEFHADWCPTCRAQEKIINGLKSDYSTLVIFRIDFDTQKSLLKRFGVRRQSTLIVFKMGKEVGRSVGDASSGGIASLLNKAV